MKQEYSVGEKEFEPTKFDKVRWDWIKPAIIIVALITLIIIAIRSADIVGYIGFGVFFILGFLLGQSRWWYAIRNMWGHFMSHDSSDIEE